MNDQCVFCSNYFASYDKGKIIPRELSIAAMKEGAADNINASIALRRLEENTDRSLCNYCHTRISVSREAAEAL